AQEALEGGGMGIGGRGGKGGGGGLRGRDGRGGGGRQGRLVPKVEGAERWPEHRHRGAPRRAAIGGLGDRHIQVLVEVVEGQVREVHGAGAGAGQPRVAEVVELRGVGEGAAVGEAGAAVGRVGV